MKGAIEQSTSGHYHESLNNDFINLQQSYWDYFNKISSVQFWPTESPLTAFKCVDTDSSSAVVFDDMTETCFMSLKAVKSVIPLICHSC